MQQVQLQVDDEVKSLGDVIVQEVADIKAKKGLAIELSDAVPALLALGGNYAKLPADAKNPDDLAYLVKCIASAIFPPAAP